MTNKTLNQAAIDNVSHGLLDLLSRSLSIASRNIAQRRQNAAAKRELQNLSAHLREDAGLEQSTPTPTYRDYSDPSLRRL